MCTQEITPNLTGYIKISVYHQLIQLWFCSLQPVRQSNRLARSMPYLIELIENLHREKAVFHSLCNAANVYKQLNIMYALLYQNLAYILNFTFQLHRRRYLRDNL